MTWSLCRSAVISPAFEFRSALSCEVGGQRLRILLNSLIDPYPWKTKQLEAGKGRLSELLRFSSSPTAAGTEADPEAVSASAPAAAG